MSVGGRFREGLSHQVMSSLYTADVICKCLLYTAAILPDAAATLFSCYFFAKESQIKFFIVSENEQKKVVCMMKITKFLKRFANIMAFIYS